MIENSDSDDSELEDIVSVAYKNMDAFNDNRSQNRTLSLTDQDQYIETTNVMDCDVARLTRRLMCTKFVNNTILIDP